MFKSKLKTYELPAKAKKCIKRTQQKKLKM